MNEQLQYGAKQLNVLLNVSKTVLTKLNIIAVETFSSQDVGTSRSLHWLQRSLIFVRI